MSIRLLTASAVALGLVAFTPAAHAQDAATVQQAIVVRDAALGEFDDGERLRDASGRGVGPLRRRR